MKYLILSLWLIGCTQTPAQTSGTVCSNAGHILVQLTYSSPQYWVCARCDRVVWKVTYGDSSLQWQTKVEQYP